MVDVQSFSGWEMTRTENCRSAPCVAPLERPIPELDAVTTFESAASSVYHGFTLSTRRRMRRGMYFRLSYTWAHAIDDLQDALVVGEPGHVQNAYVPADERADSVTDQRHRVMVSWAIEPRPFHYDHRLMRAVFNDWRLAGVVTAGSGRPVNARVVGDANRDGNGSNDRLPGVRRNAFVGPEYATTDLRLTRRFHLGTRWKLDLLAESFNVFNRANERVDTSDDGFSSQAARFLLEEKSVAGQRFPARYRRSEGFLRPVNAYAPRQVQFGIRLGF